MRKQLGIIASFVFLCATAFFWTGCSESRCYDDCAPRCEQPRRVCAEEQHCATACADICDPACKKPVKCRHPSRNELCCLDGITVYGVNPDMCMLGEQYPLDFVIKACDDVCDVVVTTHLPEGVTLIKTEPEAKVEGNKLTWNIGPMQKGHTIPAKVVVRCECEGELCACFCATATPVRFCSLLCAKPVLACHKCGPEEACPGDCVNYTITVSNRGSCVAKDVIVTDNIPDGLEHCSLQKTLCFKLGDLAPCESKVVQVPLKAVKRGNVCNTAVVSACNADSVSCQACTCICCCGITLTKTGPKEVQAGRSADYELVVTNTGDKPLNDVLVRDMAPNNTSIMAAKGATINGNEAIWRVRELKAGEKLNLGLTLMACHPGCYTNRAHVTNCQGCEACAEFTTRWRGLPALNVCIHDTEDPICVEAPTSYVIEVMNQGDEADNNVRVVVRFPEQIVPQAVSGDSQGSIDGNTVTFAPIDNFGPRHALKYRVDARAKSSGDARVLVEVTSESIKTPIVQQESTRVY